MPWNPNLGPQPKIGGLAAEKAKKWGLFKLGVLVAVLNAADGA
jgi:hypothetical protein